MALYWKNNEASGLNKGATQAEGFYRGEIPVLEAGIPVLEAGNFRTNDGMLFVTADGLTFNTKE